MKLDVAGVLHDAWALAKRDREVLIGVSGLLIFVPQLAVFLLIRLHLTMPADFETNPEAQKAFVLQMQAWMSANLPGLLLAALASLIAQIAITSLYVDRARLTVAAALARAPSRLWPVLLIALVASPLALSIQFVSLLIVPAAYLQGRLLLTMPILLGDQPISALGAIRTSWQKTGGHGLACAGLACIAVLPVIILVLPLNALGTAAEWALMANPVVALLICGCGALIASAGAIGKMLIEIALYRRLNSGT